jgi:hypothetical protein
MRKLMAVLIALVGLVPVLGVGRMISVRAQSAEPDIFIQSPRRGEPLQGVETVSGKIRGDLFQRAELSFTYAGMEEPTWFYLAEFNRKDIDENTREFAYDWDTTRITDGDYHLRIRAEYQDGELVELVENLRIRNYSPVETRTPGPEPTGETRATPETPTVRPTVQPTPTPFPANPASLTEQDLLRSLRLGLTAAGVFFSAGGLYLLIKTVRRKS